MESAALGAVLSAVIKNVVAKVMKLVEKRYYLWKGFPNDIDFIKRELLMIAGAEEDQLSEKGDPSAVKRVSMEEMRDLAHDIEDCLDRIMRCAEDDREASLLHRLKAVGLSTGSLPFATEVKQLKVRLLAAHQRKYDYNVNGSHPAALQQEPSWMSSSAIDSETTRVEPVGIDKPKRELLELLRDMEGQPEHLNVISIVGFSGSGKSTLAKALYDCPDIVSQFPCRAWVVASDHRGNSMGFLRALLEKLLPGDGGPARSHVHQVQDDITNYLNTKR